MRSAVTRAFKKFGRRFGARASLGARRFGIPKQRFVQNDLATPGALLVAGGLGFSLYQAFSAPDYAAIRKDIADLLDADDYDDGSYGPVFVRLAWHSAGTFCQFSKNGGSNGATMRFSPECDDGANAGLDKARAFLAPLKAKYPNISHADLWSLAGTVAIEEMGGPKMKWTPGRTDKPSGDYCPPVGRLPDAARGDDHLRAVFYRMGFSDREIVALSGAHALGRCHTDRSGFWGPWTRAPTTFSNEYFRELVENTWTVKKTHKGGKWTGPMQYEDPTGDLMMLPTDMALIKDPSFKKVVLEYAKDEATFFKDFAAAWSKLQDLGFKK